MQCSRHPQYGVTDDADPRGTVTSYTYDALGRLIGERLDEEGLALESVYAYDAAGNLAQITDPRGVTTTFEYNALNQLLKQCRDAGGLNLCTTYTYDPLGNQETVTDPNGVTTRVEHNAFGLPEQVIADYGTGGSDLNATTALDYDNALNLQRMTDANGNETWYAFTARNEVAAENYADDTAVGYTYDGRGNVGVQTLQDGQAITHTYDALGRVTGKALAASGWQTYTYDDAGRLVRHTHTAADQTVLADYQYALDGLGNRTGTTETLTATRAITQVFDGLNRLASSAYSTGEAFTYTYDAVGNRAVMTSVTPLSGTVVTTYTFDAANRLTDREVSDGRTYTYTWSNRGQMTAEWTNGYAVRTFSYDDAGRMTEATVFTLTTKFTYNGDGVRLAVEVVGQGTTTYTVDYGGGYRVLAEENITGTLLYLYGRECLGQYDDEWLYYLDDATGYVRQGTDDQGVVISAWLFDPDGLVLEGPQGPVSHLMCRGVYDWSTGLIYKDQRYFDPTLGIWLALAPLVVIQSWRGRKKRRWWYPWYVVVLCVMGVGGMLVGCGPTGTPTGTAAATTTCTVSPAATDTPGPSASTPMPTPIRTQFGPPISDKAVFVDPPSGGKLSAHPRAQVWTADEKKAVEKAMTDVIKDKFGGGRGFGSLNRALAELGVSAGDPIEIIRQSTGSSPGSLAAMVVIGGAQYIKVYDSWFDPSWADATLQRATFGHELTHYWDYAHAGTLHTEMKGWINWGDTATDYGTYSDDEDLGDAVTVYFWDKYDEGREWTDDIGAGLVLANDPKYGGRGADGLRLAPNYASFPLNDRRRLSATGADRVYDRYDWLECKFTSSDCKP